MLQCKDTLHGGGFHSGTRSDRVFRHDMPHCLLSQRNKLGCSVAAGLEEGPFLSVQGCSHLSLCHFVKSCMDASLHAVSR